VLLISLNASAQQHISAERYRKGSAYHSPGIIMAYEKIEASRTDPANPSQFLTVRSGAAYEVVYYSPKIVLKPGFKAETGSFFTATTPRFNAHVVVVDDNAQYPDYTNCSKVPDDHCATFPLGEPDVEYEIERLNKSFYTESGVQLVTFNLNEVVTWNDLVASGLDSHVLVNLITANQGTQHLYYGGRGLDCDWDGYGCRLVDVHSPKDGVMENWDCDGVAPYDGIDVNSDGIFIEQFDQNGDGIRDSLDMDFDGTADECDTNQNNIGDPSVDNNLDGYVDDNTGNHIQTVFNNTTSEPDIRDTDAINIYIYNQAHADDHGNTGHGRNNGMHPYVLIDYDRFQPLSVDSATLLPEEDVFGYPIPQYRPIDHEIGHGFNLGHTCDSMVASNSTPSNIMSSSGHCDLTTCCSGHLSGTDMGDRSVGFYNNDYDNCDASCQEFYSDAGYGQSELVMWSAFEIAKEFGIINNTINVL
jgi:hypothetical protein